MPLFSFTGKSKKNASPAGTRADFRPERSSQSTDKGKGKGKGKGGTPARPSAHSPRTPRTPRELWSQEELANDIEKKLTHVRDACFGPLTNTIERNSASPDKVDLVMDWLEAACKGCQELQKEGQRLDSHLELVDRISETSHEFEELRTKVDLWRRGDLPASSGIAREQTGDDVDGEEDSDDDEEEEEEEEEDEEGDEEEESKRAEEEQRAEEEARRQAEDQRLKMEEEHAAKRKREEDEEARKSAEENQRRLEEEQARQHAAAEEAKRAQEAREAEARDELEAARHRLEVEPREAEEERYRKDGETKRTEDRPASTEKDESHERLPRGRAATSDSADDATRGRRGSFEDMRERETSDHFLPRKRADSNETRSRQSKDDFLQKGAADDDEPTKQSSEWFGTFEANPFDSFCPRAGEKESSKSRSKEDKKRRSHVEDFGANQPTRQTSSDSSLKVGNSRASLPEPQWKAHGDEDTQDIKRANGWGSRRISEDASKSHSQKQKEKKRSKGESKKDRALESMAFKEQCEWPEAWPTQQSSRDSVLNQDTAQQDWCSWDVPGHNVGNSMLGSAVPPPPPPPTRTMSMGSLMRGPSNESIIGGPPALFSMRGTQSKDSLRGLPGSIPSAPVASTDSIVGSLTPATIRPSKRSPSAPTHAKAGKQLPLESTSVLPTAGKQIRSESSATGFRLHIRRPYAEVHDMEAFKAQFVRAASVAAGVPPHRIRVKSVRCGR